MPPSADGFTTWQKRFTTCVSSADNLPTGQAFKALCAAGCDPVELYQVLWDYSRLKIDRKRHEQKSKDAIRGTKKYLYLAGLLNGVATEFADLVRFEQANGFPVIARAL